VEKHRAVLGTLRMDQAVKRQELEYQVDQHEELAEQQQTLLTYLTRRVLAGRDGLLPLPREGAEMVNQQPVPTTLDQIVDVKKIENDNLRMLGELEQTEQALKKCEELLAD